MRWRLTRICLSTVALLGGVIAACYDAGFGNIRGVCWIAVIFVVLSVIEDWAGFLARRKRIWKSPDGEALTEDEVFDKLMADRRAAWEARGEP